MFFNLNSPYLKGNISTVMASLGSSWSEITGVLQVGNPLA